MIPKSLIFLAILLIPLALITLYLIGDERGIIPDLGQRSGQVTLRVDDTPVQVDVARTSAERQQGLSGRARLNENGGLLFLFENPGLHGIWMKDMLIPIDILWLDDSGRIITIARNVIPETYPTVFYPDAPATYVLELSANFTELRSIKVGDLVEIPDGL